MQKKKWIFELERKIRKNFWICIEKKWKEKKMDQIKNVFCLC